MLTHVQRHHTGDHGTGHGGAAFEGIGAVYAGGDDAAAGGCHICPGAVVGIERPVIGGIGGHNGNDTVIGGGIVDAVGSVIAHGGHDGNTFGHRVFDGRLHAAVIEVAAQTHIDHHGAVADGCVDAPGDHRVRAASAGIQDPDAENADIGSDARTAEGVIHGGGDDTGHMGTMSVFIGGTGAHADLRDLTVQIRVIRLDTGVDDGDLDGSPAGGDAPGSVGIHHIMHVLVVGAGGITQVRVGTAHIFIDPGVPVLLAGDSRSRGAGRGVGVGLHRVKTNQVVGVSRGQRQRHILSRRHRLGNGGGQGADLRHTEAVGHQLAAEGPGVNLSLLLGVGGDHQNARLVVLAFRQPGHGLGDLIIGHFLLGGQLLLAEDIFLRQTRQTKGQLWGLGLLGSHGLLRRLRFLRGFGFLIGLRFLGGSGLLIGHGAVFGIGFRGRLRGLLRIGRFRLCIHGGFRLRHNGGRFSGSFRLRRESCREAANQQRNRQKQG